MGTATPTRAVPPPPGSASTADPVLAQLERILASPSFRNSRRYTDFLRFVVEQTLLGHADTLKERLIGIRVFDRAPDYDLATDSIVRVAAGEIRKRLAQYYIGSAQRGELRIELQPGSYVPEFRPAEDEAAGQPAGQAARPAPVAPAQQGEAATPLPVPLRPAKAVLSVPSALAVLALAVLLGGAFFFALRSAPGSVGRFWAPLLGSRAPVLFCLGDPTDVGSGLTLPNSNAQATGARGSEYLNLGDVEAMNRVFRVFAQHGIQAATASSSSTTLAELRRQPVVFIGGSTNRWTMRSMALLRFQLVPNFTPGVNAIRDREDPSHIRWKVDFNPPFATIPRTYAIVARFVDPTTGQPTVIIDGVGAAATIAAAEFLTNPEYFETGDAPRGWQQRNLELVLEIQLVNGDWGPPHVIAAHSW